MENKRISAVINTYNASEHLAKVLDHLKGFDEIVVCDMESTDDTIAIAHQYGCKTVTFPKGDIKICEPARNTAIQAASNDWVLVVDADELIPHTLRDYLYEFIKNPGDTMALDIPRINKFMGSSISSTPDFQLRFFRKEKVDWPAIIHANPKIDGPVKKVPTRSEFSIIHLDDASISSRLNKLNNYTDYEVPKRSQKHYGALSIFVRPVWFFIKNYIIGGGYKDGKRGLVHSYMASVYQIVLLAKLLEKETLEKK